MSWTASPMRSFLLSAVLAGAATTAVAAPLVAIVEEAHAPSTGLQVMDYLTAGTEIRLKSGESLTISYFRSCAIEQITAGSVRIGVKRSRVLDQATVRRRIVECKIRNIRLTPRQAGQSAAVVVREMPADASARGAALMVYSTAPVFVLSRRVRVVLIERLDRAGGAPHRVATRDGRADLMDSKIRLARGAIYRATTAFGTATFKISPFADDNESVLLRRLIAF